MSKHYFSGAFYYRLSEEISPQRLKDLKCIDSIVEIRVKFKEEILNGFVFNLKFTHLKIKLVWEQLVEYDQQKNELLCANVSLTEIILEDVISKNLLEFQKLIEDLKEVFSHKYGLLYRRISEKKLKQIDKNIIFSKYLIARKFLFPDLIKNEVNVPNHSYDNILEQVFQVSKELKNFRDKVLAHSDKDKFDTRLTYQKYLEIYQYIVDFLDAITVVATLQLNDWDVIDENDYFLNKKWIESGLKNSLKRYQNNL